MTVYGTRHPDLSDCGPTKKLIGKIDTLITAMMSRTKQFALTASSECLQYKAITDFLNYVQSWEQTTKACGYVFMSASTCYGFKVTLRTTLELMHFLNDQCNFEYLMNARLNQDALERFFGMMRGACGFNDHPDSILFAQVFRLMSTYSLVKPPRRCNVSGSEILLTLVSTEEINNNYEQLALWQKTLDDVVERGYTENEETEHIHNTVIYGDHNYNITATTDFAQAYVAGYVARKCTRFTKCDLCIESVCLKPGEVRTRDKVIDLISYGYLKHPSDQLFNLFKLLEGEILQVMSTQDLNKNTFFAMSVKIGQLEDLPLIGCAEHNHFLTKHDCHFYLVTRSHFISKRYNEINDAQRKKTRRNRKNAKL